jgi:phosphohistidine phosphatase
MLELYIIRHGLAGTAIKEKTKDDKRPLKKKGKEQIKVISKSLKKQKIDFDLILTSPLLRAKETADIVREHCGKGKEVITTKHLSPESSYNNLIKYLNSLKAKKVALVGHEPFLSGFTSYCLTKNKNLLINLKKGGVLMLEVDKTIKPGKCTLSWLMEPKQLKNIS